MILLGEAWKRAFLEEEAQLSQVLQQLPKTKSSQIHRSLACADGRFVPIWPLIRSRDGGVQVARYMRVVPMSYREASPATNKVHYSTLVIEPKAYWPAYLDQLRDESHRGDYRLVDDPAGKSRPESLSKPSKRASILPYSALQTVADARCSGDSEFARGCAELRCFTAKISQTVETTVKQSSSRPATLRGRCIQ
jgi:hypothetical protein